MSYCMTGSILSLFENYGFIKGNDGINRFFIPSSIRKEQLILWDQLKEGMRVEFEHEDAPKGPRATNVTVLDEPVIALSDEEV